MKRLSSHAASAFVLVGLLLVAAPSTSRAEVIEEIVAWINGEIITKSDYEEEEQMRIAEAYRRFSGEELDKWVQEAREGMLLQMIDRKIMVHHAQALGYDIERMGDAFLESFKEQQNIKNDEDFEKLLEQDGMTVQEVKRTLVEMYAPEEVIRFEITSRLSVGNLELESYYAQNPEQFVVPGEVTFREIVLRAGNEDARLRRRGEAEELRGRLLAGGDFAQIAMESSEAGTAEAGGLLGPLKEEDLSPEIARTAFELPIGEISEIVELPHGFHIIRVESRIDAHTQSLEEVRDKLRVFLEERKYRTDLNTFLDKARRESEWCVKPSFRHLLSIPSPDCETL